jgi:hypothetical protein
MYTTVKGKARALYERFYPTVVANVKDVTDWEFNILYLAIKIN